MAMLVLPASAGLKVLPSACLLQRLYFSNNALTGTIPWNWALPDTFEVSMQMQGHRAC